MYGSRRVREWLVVLSWPAPNQTNRMKVRAVSGQAVGQTPRFSGSGSPSVMIIIISQCPSVIQSVGAWVVGPATERKVSPLTASPAARVDATLTSMLKRPPTRIELKPEDKAEARPLILLFIFSCVEQATRPSSVAVGPRTHAGRWTQLEDARKAAAVEDERKSQATSGQTTGKATEAQPLALRCACGRYQ